MVKMPKIARFEQQDNIIAFTLHTKVVEKFVTTHYRAVHTISQISATSYATRKRLYCTVKLHSM